MSTTVELFERFKAHLTVQADHAAGQILGVKPQTISNWRTRGSQAEPKLIELMCRKLGEDPMPWLLRAQAEQAHDPANEMVWKRVASRLGVSLSAIALFLGRSHEAAAQGVNNLVGDNAFAAGIVDAMGQALSALPLG